MGLLGRGSVGVDGPTAVETWRRYAVQFIIAVLFLVLWIVLGFWSLSERQRAREAAEATLVQVTQAVAEQTLRMLKLTEMSLMSAAEWLQQNPQIRPSDSPEFIALVDRMHRLTGGVVEYRFVDPEGNIYALSGSAHLPGGNVGQRENFKVQQDERTRGFYISDPVISPINGKWVVPITYPVVGAANQVAVISGVIDLGRMTELFEAQRVKPNGSITLLKSNGTTLFRAPMVENSIGRSLAASKDFTEHFNLAEQGLYVIAGAYDGVQRIVSFKGLADYGLIVATTTAEADALASWRRESWIIGSGAALTTILMALMVLRFLRDTHLAEAAVRARERQISSILDTSAVGIFLMNRDAIITRANASLARMLALDPAAAVGSCYLDFLEPDCRADAAIAIREHFDGKFEELSRERRYIRRDGTDFLGNVSSRRLIDDQGNPTGLVLIITDITDRRRWEESLQKNQEQLTAILNSTTESIFQVDRDGILLAININAARRVSKTPEEMIGKCCYDFFPIEVRDGRRAALEAVFLNGQVKYLEDSRNAHYFALNFYPIAHQSGAVESVVIYARDITERKRDEISLRLSASVFANSYEGIMVTDSRQRIVDVNPAFSRITGYSRAEVLGHSPKMLSSGRHASEFYIRMWNFLLAQDYWQGEIWNRRKEGEVYAQMLAISAVRDDSGSLRHYIGVFSDISHLKAHEAELNRIAHFDALTGVPNRRLLADRLGQAIVHARRSHHPFALCYLDLDGFKAINDQFGHRAGDSLLIAVTERLKGVLRAEDTLARLGGDEFALLFADLAEGEEIKLVLERVLSAVNLPITLEEGVVQVSASIGVTLFPADDVDAELLLAHADEAMYQAKQLGKNRYCQYCG